MSKYGGFPGPHFLVFGLNIGKYGSEKPPYLDIHVVITVTKYSQIFFDDIFDFLMKFQMFDIQQKA